MVTCDAKETELLQYTNTHLPYELKDIIKSYFTHTCN